MTKVQAQFKLTRPLDAETAKCLSNTSSLYGILRLQVLPNRLCVEYDATRLKEQDVEAALKRAGVAAEPFA
jgi:hypothetical protein